MNRRQRREQRSGLTEQPPAQESHDTIGDQFFPTPFPLFSPVQKRRAAKSRFCGYVLQRRQSHCVSFGVVKVVVNWLVVPAGTTVVGSNSAVGSMTAAG